MVAPGPAGPGAVSSTPSPRTIMLLDFDKIISEVEDELDDISIMEGMLQVHGLLREQGLDPEREETWISLLMGMSLSVTMHQHGIDFFLAADHVSKLALRAVRDLRARG